MVLGGMLAVAPPLTGLGMGPPVPIVIDEPGYLLSEERDTPHYIDSEDSEEDSKENGNAHSIPEVTPQPLFKTIAFDWSSLNFGDLQFSTLRLPEEEEVDNHSGVERKHIDRYSEVELLPDDTYGRKTNTNAVQNFINSSKSGHKDKLRDPKTIFRECKRKLIKSGKNLKDRSRSVETFQGSSCPRTLSSVTRRADSTERSSSVAQSPLARARSGLGTMGSVASLHSGVKLRARLRDTMWVTGVRRRESIGLLTQPMISAIRGAGRRVKGRARSISKSRGSLSGGSDDSHSAVHSSDADEDGERPDSASLLDRFRGLRKDMQKKISKVKSPRGAPAAGGISDGDYSTPVSDGRGLRSPPAPDSTVDKTVFSNRSSSSGGLPSPNAPPPPAPYTGPFIGRAVALVDFQSAYDDDLLKFKKGDVIDIISKNPTGHWKGCLNGRVGEFKFILVEEQRERGRRRGGAGGTAQLCPYPSLEALLKQLHLGHLLQVFMLNGYENLDQFREVEERDLDSLGIKDPDIRKRLMTAAASIPEAAPAGEADTSNAAASYRDSGCFTDQRIPVNLAPELDENNVDGRQSSPSTDNSSGYQSRGNYSLPNAGEVISTLQEVPDNTLDSSSSAEEASATHRGKNFPGQHSASDPGEVPNQRGLQKDKSETNVCSSKDEDDDQPLGPDSYRATQVLVRPGTPDPEDDGEPLELRNKSVGYNSSDVDLDPVSPRCSSDTGVFVQSEGDSVTEEPPGSDQG